MDFTMQGLEIMHDHGSSVRFVRQQGCEMGPFRASKLRLCQSSRSSHVGRSESRGGRKNVRANANAPGMRRRNRKTKDHDPEFLAMPMDGEFRHRR